jgi:hypothetical protein
VVAHPVYVHISMPTHSSRPFVTPNSGVLYEVFFRKYFQSLSGTIAPSSRGKIGSLAYRSISRW